MVGAVHDDNVENFYEIFFRRIDKVISQMFFDHCGEISQDHAAVVTPESTVFGYFEGILNNIIEFKLNVRVQAGFRSMNVFFQIRVRCCTDLVHDQFCKTFFTQSQCQLTN